jgi:ATP-dependent Clp protease ATP-binding subunit ClpC
LELSASAQEFLADKGYDPELGARPLRRAIQTYVEDVLSEKILFKEFRAGQTIVVDAAEGPEGPYLTFEGVEGLPPSVDFEDLSTND